MIRFKPMSPEEIARSKKMLEAGRQQELTSGKLIVPTEIVFTPEERAASLKQFEADLIEVMMQPISEEATDESSAPGEPDES